MHNSWEFRKFKGSRKIIGPTRKDELERLIPKITEIAAGRRHFPPRYGMPLVNWVPTLKMTKPMTTSHSPEKITAMPCLTSRRFRLTDIRPIQTHRVRCRKEPKLIDKQEVLNLEEWERVTLNRKNIIEEYPRFRANILRTR